MKQSLFTSRLIGCARRAFSLVEILVVLVIIGILVAIALPAINSMLESQEQIAAETRMSAALQTARDAALTTAVGEDTAAVFVYDVQGPLRIIPCIKVGNLPDPALAKVWEIFVPLDTYEPASLPQGWTVRAYAPAAAFTATRNWYNATNGSIERYETGKAHWVFPETHFYNHLAVDQGDDRQTFMVRFQAGSGEMVGSELGEALVLLPRPTNQNRDTGLPQELRADLAGDYPRLVRRLLSDPQYVNDAMRLIGPESSDMVLTRPVHVLALMEEKRLAEAIGVRLDPISQSVYLVPRDDFRNGLSITPAYVPGAAPAVIASRTHRWIEGYADVDGDATSPLVQAEERAARLFTVDRYTGQLKALSVPVRPN